MPFVPDNQAVVPAPPWGAVIQDALYKGAAGLPDMVLNAPNRIANLTKALFGSVANASGRSDLAPETTQDPDIVRGALEQLGLIRNVKPKGFAQKAASTVIEGATGGALTGGASLPGVIAGGTMGALSAGAGDAVAHVTKSPEAGIVASLFAPTAAGKVANYRPNVSQEVRTLDQAGVSLTPGQIAGSTGTPVGRGIQRAEDALSSIPFTGDFIRNAQRRGHESFNTAANNRALEPVGEKLPPGVKPGRESVAYTQDRLGQMYDDLLVNMKGSLDGPNGPPPPNALPPPGGAAPAASTLRQEVENLRQMMNSGNIPPEQKRQFSDILDNEIIARFSPSGGLAPGTSLKEIESQLGTLSSTFGRSDNYDVRRLSGAVKEAQSALRRMVERENPGQASELQNINEGYANFKRVQDASGKPYSPDGIFTPSTLNSSVRSGDRSKDKSKFTRGEAVLQDMSDAGKSVMTKTVPDSGTPLRSIFTRGEIIAPIVASPVAPVYSKVGQAAIQKTLLAPKSEAIENASNRAVIPAAEQADEREDRKAAKPAKAEARGRFVPDAPPPADKPKSVPNAPRDRNERVVGAIYKTPKGDMEWSENGWLTLKR